MEQGTRWAVRGDHLRGRDDSAMPTLERCCHAKSAHGAAQSPHAWHVGDRKAVSHAGSCRDRSWPTHLFSARGKLLLSDHSNRIEHPPSCIRPSAAGGLVGGHAGPIQNGAP